MKKIMINTFIVLLLGFACIHNANSQGTGITDWEGFVIERLGSKPDTGGIICIGSSHMEIWKTIKKDLDSLTIYNLGIGGTTMKVAADEFAENLVIPYKPRAVILYEGSNDIAADVTSEEILSQFKDFYAKVHQELPNTRIYVLGVVPSPGRFEKWDVVQETNALLKEVCSKGELLMFIDTTSPLIGDDGKPRKECFISDNVHMNKNGYAIWTKAVAPVVKKIEIVFE